ncbi:hypothetical protein [Streptomyces sp. JJ38]|uniref:hypothetical protein n=1 Tax=Streptomyces sp. JJ38 TaxID=2738128 RepID=UPI001C55A7FB|nr:hypothetical protein [Streptomyces sp. JJ38]MBW1596354.1 hypothetical protein [Streptomyces sp. JJ38]
MRHLVERAFAACLRALLSRVLPASGRRRRAHGEPHIPAREPLGRWRNAEEPLRPRFTHRSPYAAESAAPAVVEDGTRLVRWYVVIAESAAWLDQVRAERRNALLPALEGVDVGPDVMHGVRAPVTTAG